MVGKAVVVGVNGSVESRDAAILGRRIAVAAGGALHLVTATQDPLTDVAATKLRLDVAALHEAEIAAARKAVRNSLAGDFRTDELSDLLVARLGRPEHVLAEVGLEAGADLFVLGGKRHDRATSWIRRGTAHHLLRVSESPVLATGPRGPDVERVLVALDLSSAAGPTLRVATDLAELLEAPLEAVHVVNRPTFLGGQDSGIDLEEYLDAGEEAARRRLWPMLPDGAARTMLRGEPVDAIAQAAADGSPALLVLGARGRGGIHRLLLGSTTEALLARLPSSLAIVPPEAVGT